MSLFPDPTAYRLLDAATILGPFTREEYDNTGVDIEFITQYGHAGDIPDPHHYHTPPEWSADVRALASWVNDNVLACR